MKKLLLFLVFGYLCASSAHAQIQKLNPYAGNFVVSKHTSKGEEGANVNFVMQPVPFINVLHLDLNTPYPMAMSVKIVNTSGAVVLSWMPQTVNATYEHQFDIAALQPGKYKLEIFGADNMKIHTVSFEKQNGNTNQNANRN